MRAFVSTWTAQAAISGPLDADSIGTIAVSFSRVLRGDVRLRLVSFGDEFPEGIV